MELSSTSLDPAAAGPIAAELERLQAEQAELSQEHQTLWRDGTERRQNGATLDDIAHINARLEELHAQRCELAWRIRDLEGPAANEQHGWTRLRDGSYGKMQPNGKTLTVHGGISERTENGVVYKDTPEDQRRRADRHRAVALAFQAEVAERRLSHAKGPQRPARPTRQTRTIVVGRSRRTIVRTAAPSRGDPDDPDPEPWQDLDEWLDERKRALDALTGGEQLRLDGGQQ